MHYKFLTFFCIFFCFASALVVAQTNSVSATIPTDEVITFWSDYPNDVLASEITKRMTDEETFAQILMFGWSGLEPTPLLLSWVIERELGSVKAFGWDTDDATKVAEAVVILQDHAQNARFQIPLYVATDQEGGKIRHIKGLTSDTPGNLAIGASGYTSDAWYSGYYIGKELRALGINMNFAPTVDLYTNQASIIIGSRSFGADPQSSGALGAAFSNGSMVTGVIPTAKHFPGHGDTSIDSHVGLPIIDIDEETLFNRELVPFENLIDEGIPAIMSAHLSFPNILPSGEPASLSKYFLTDILRNKLGYTGLIITDGIEMDAATSYAGAISIAVRLAIEAGSDIIMSSLTPGLEEALWTRNLSLMERDAEFNLTVRQAAHRVILSKLNYFKGENPVPIFPDIEAIPSLVPAPEADAFFTSQAARAITLYKEGDFPYTPEEAAKDRILVVGQFQEVFDESNYRYDDLTYLYFDYNLDAFAVQEEGLRLVEAAQNYDTIIMCVADASSRDVALYLADSGKRVIIISVLEPVHVFDFDWADSILLAYSYSSFSFRAAFSALAGDYVPKGILPMENP